VGNFLKVLAFSVLVIGFFAGFANFGIPQIKPAPPPAEEQIDVGAMGIEDLIALGERIFNGKGTCTLCHNAVGGRAPLLDNVAVVAAERLADPRYQGQARSAEEYLHESLVEPSAYVVAGFGKAGSNDTESPMPDVSGGGIGLGEVEIAAVIAYLQDRAGLEVTVEIPQQPEGQGAGEEASAGAGGEASAGGDRRPLYDAPEKIVAALGCTACHAIAGAGGAIGPDLSDIGARRDRDYIRRAILDPNAEVAEGFPPGMMPPTYGEQLYARELEMLVEYLASAQ